MSRITCALALTASLAAPLHATTLFSDTFLPQQPGWSFASPSPGFLGELHNQVNVASVTLTVTAPNDDPNGTLEFDLLGFRSIDGTNCCTDTLTLTINGTVAFTGAWTYDDFYSTFFINPSGATFQPSVIGGYGASSVSHRITVPHHLLQGTNTYTWSYSQLQTFEDEAWGLDNVTVDGFALRYRLPFLGGPYDITNAPDCPKHKPQGSVDYGLFAHTPVIASEEGDIVSVGQDPSNCYGMQVLIAHPDGRQTRYAHLSQTAVVPGQSVARGEVIALSGNSTGTSNNCTPGNKPLGYHLHFEIIDAAGALDSVLIASLPGTAWVAPPGARRLCQNGSGTIDGTAYGPPLPQ